MSGFNVILPTLLVKLDIPQAGAVWPAGAFALVTAAFLLPFGRLADKYGAYPIFILGLIWFCVWSVIAGFAINELMLDFCRALQGLGPSAFLPSGVSLMSNMYRPGPRKKSGLQPLRRLSTSGLLLWDFHCRSDGAIPKVWLVFLDRCNPAIYYYYRCYFDCTE